MDHLRRVNSHSQTHPADIPIPLWSMTKPATCMRGIPTVHPPNPNLIFGTSKTLGFTKTHKEEVKMEKNGDELGYM